VNRKPFLSLSLSKGSRNSLQDQLATALKARILDGTILAGEPLPSSRELATDLRISRNTVVAACERLLGEGYLEAIPRAGLFVSCQLLGKSRPLNRTDSQPAARTNRSPRPFLPERDDPLIEPAPFRPCRPDVRLFPMSRWTRYRTRAVQKFGTRLLQYQPGCALGLPALRKALATYLNESRGVRCDWHQVAITSGSQQALYLLSQLLIAPQDRVMIEDPGYLGARNAFEQMKVKLCPLPVDRIGVISKSNEKRIKLIYSTPSRQFPTGACLPVGRRMELLDLANRTQAWLIEDDYDSEFRYTRPPFPSLHSLDLNQRVIYLGTMSKVLCPTLRIGYVVLPHELVEPFERLKIVVDEQGPLVDQATLALFIASGDFYSHIRRCRKVYSRRLEVFLNEAKGNHLPLDFPNVDGGMNQTGFTLDPEVDTQSISNRLATAGFEVPSIAPFSLKKAASGFLFGFTAFDETTIKQSMTRLAKLLHRELK
jgi:GntR family transcriptional regulator / MocR family aminotransferase